MESLVIRKKQYAKVEAHEEGMEVRIRCYQKMAKSCWPHLGEGEGTGGSWENRKKHEVG